jgi:hypothetical protein
MAPPTCPNCGEYVPTNAHSCPGCGADENTGWNDTANAQSLGIGDDEEFDYDEFIANEFDPARKPKVKVEGISWFWWIVAIVALCLILSFYF